MHLYLHAKIIKFSSNNELNEKVETALNTKITTKLINLFSQLKFFLVQTDSELVSIYGSKIILYE